VYLLDTHIWLWSLLEPKRLSPRVTKVLMNPGSELWLSSISVWEFLILARKKKITIDREAIEWVQEALKRIPLREAPLTNEISIATATLKLSHQDPADRFILATAQVHGMTLITADEKLMSNKQTPILANH
jgi:PIN domain nuclease of toxin-antitoxin system